MKKILSCRSTGMGGYTAPAGHSPDVTITEFDKSRTGNHWKVEIDLPNPLSFVEIRDISNSGKHSCHFIYGDGHEETICSVGQPPSCSRRECR
jgi:hypothetical protein